MQHDADDAPQVQVPAWADMVKLSTGSELAPYDADWFYIRTGPPARHFETPPMPIVVPNFLIACQISYYHC